MLWMLPLEPLDERYTAQWYDWFRYELKTRGVEFVNVLGQRVGDTVTKGLVLDICGTSIWKMSQMHLVGRHFNSGDVKPGDKFFTWDLWHPGLEIIPYMSQLLGIPVEVYGFLHAGSYTEYDFAQPLAPWARYFEEGWHTICKKVFVGSHFHKNDFLLKRFGGYEPRFGGYEPVTSASLRMVVTGCPFSTSDVLATCPTSKRTVVWERDNVIVFSSRWDREKRPDIFMDIIEELWRRRPGEFRVVITTGRKELRSNDPALVSRLHTSIMAGLPYYVKTGLSKQEYYRNLARGKVWVSTAQAEYFGYSLVEAMTLGCHPVVPNGLCYPEMLPRGVDSNRCLYDPNNVDEAVRVIGAALDAPIDYTAQVEVCNRAVGRILDEMGCTPIVGQGAETRPSSL